MVDVELLLLRKQDRLDVEGARWGEGNVAWKDSCLSKVGPAAEITADLGGAERLVKFSEPIEPFLPVVGHVPLPPYIHEKSAATPNAIRRSMLVSPVPRPRRPPVCTSRRDSWTRLRAQGVALAYVTLHVGLDTFAPVTEAEAEQHAIHTEWCDVSRGSSHADKSDPARRRPGDRRGYDLGPDT